MPQSNNSQYSAGVLPFLHKLGHSSLSIQELEHLYALTDWRVVLLDNRIGKTYGRFSTISLFKALALPFLINIPSERALVREIEERESLQSLCGFLSGMWPERGTFWHFRRRYADLYPELMLRVLIALVLSGVEPNLSLPFVTPVSQTAGIPEGIHSKFRIDAYRPPIEVWTAVSAHREEIAIRAGGKSWSDVLDEIEQRKKLDRQLNGRKRGLSSGLGLPAEILTELHDGRSVRFGIEKPAWMDVQTGQADTLTSLGSASSKPYAACNVLITRDQEDRRQVLLSRRMTGYGKGTYVLPGGKQRSDESLEDCAVREVWEETGIHVYKSRPISLHRTRLPGKPPVLSVGVLADEYEGRPTRREPSQNTEWQWVNLGELPASLFEPTRLAIRHYLDGTYHGLSWSDVEAQMPTHWHTTRQLELPF